MLSVHRFRFPASSTIKHQFENILTFYPNLITLVFTICTYKVLYVRSKRFRITTTISFWSVPISTGRGGDEEKRVGDPVRNLLRGV